MMASRVSASQATGLTSLSLHVATRDESRAQFSAPTSWPANRAFFRVRQTGRMAFSTGLVRPVRS